MDEVSWQYRPETFNNGQESGNNGQKQSITAKTVNNGHELPETSTREGSISETRTSENSYILQISSVFQLILYTSSYAYSGLISEAREDSGINRPDVQ